MSDTDVYYDIPIFKSIPPIIRENAAIEQTIPNTDLQDISIEDIYQLEPFHNKYYHYTSFFIIILFIFFLFCFFRFFLK